MSGKNVLIIEDDDGYRAQLKWALRSDYTVMEADDGRKAIEIAMAAKPAVVLVDLGLPPAPDGVSEGFRVIREINKILPHTKVLVITGHDERENALKSVDAGVFDFMTKPVDMEELLYALRRAFRLQDIERENSTVRGLASGQFTGLAGKSPAMQEVFRTIGKVSATDVPLLIYGESGTGKELVASAVHGLSLRKDGPFTVINCGAIPADLLESELFGYEKGSFTGAAAMKKGRIELAQGGTVFFDEIGELPLALQVKFLRFLQDFNVERIGGREPIFTDVRVIAATNRDLDAMAGNGTFRNDLYYRLSVITLELPPLRERGDDIEILALAFLKRYSSELRKRIAGYDEGAVSAMRAHGWPGNVRELENRIKRAVVLCNGNRITAVDLGLEASEEGPYGDGSEGLTAARGVFEKKMILQSLLRNKGIVTRTAKDLKVSRQHLSELIKKYNIKS